MNTIYLLVEVVDNQEEIIHAYTNKRVAEEQKEIKDNYLNLLLKIKKQLKEVEENFKKKTPYPRTKFWRTSMDGADWYRKLNIAKRSFIKEHYAFWNTLDGNGKDVFMINIDMDMTGISYVIQEVDCD